jgi:hypothetical protein
LKEATKSSERGREAKASSFRREKEGKQCEVC